MIISMLSFQSNREKKFTSNVNLQVLSNKKLMKPQEMEKIKKIKSKRLPMQQS